MNKKKLRLEDLKVESFVPLRDDELKDLGGALTAGACTNSFNCNSDLGGSHFRCCSATCNCTSAPWGQFCV